MKVDVKDSPQGTTALTSSVGHTKLSIIEMRKKETFFYYSLFPDDSCSSNVPTFSQRHSWSKFNQIQIYNKINIYLYLWSFDFLIQRVDNVLLRYPGSSAGTGWLPPRPQGGYCHRARPFINLTIMSRVWGGSLWLKDPRTPMTPGI